MRPTIVWWWILLVAALGLQAAELRPVGARVLEPFDYRGVSLGDGPLLSQVLEVRAEYLRVPTGGLLKGCWKACAFDKPPSR